MGEDTRAAAHTPEARQAGLEYPKRLVLLGVQGCGKTLFGKAIAHLLSLPLVTMDFGAVRGSLVGESEQRLRGALRTVSALGGCVLLVDEADKVFANSADSAGDSGVGQRLLGKFLSWLQDKQDRTFVVLTMNRVKGIPPELLRKGRFDELFYVER